MEPEELYKKLKRIEEIEAKLPTDKKIQVGVDITCLVSEYHMLVNSIPLMSSEDIIQYHSFLVQKTIAEAVKDEKAKLNAEREELSDKMEKLGTQAEELAKPLIQKQKELLRQRTLEALRSETTSNAYKRLEAAIDAVYNRT